MILFKVKKNKGKIISSQNVQLYSKPQRVKAISEMTFLHSVLEVMNYIKRQCGFALNSHFLKDKQQQISEPIKCSAKPNISIIIIIMESHYVPNSFGDCAVAATAN